MTSSTVAAEPGALAQCGRATALLHRVHRLIDLTYLLGTGHLDVADFVIGDGGLRLLHDGRWMAGRDAAATPAPMLLVRTADGCHHVRLYYPDRLIANLERHDPTRGLGEHNLRDFSAFVEEMDHLLQVARASQLGRPVRPVELELHANVTKVLAAALFLARTLGLDALGEGQRRELTWELLERGDFDGEEPALRERYRTARRHAVRFLHRLGATPRAERAPLLRRFSRGSLADRIALSG